MKTVIEFYTEYDGTQPVLLFLKDLQEKSQSNEDVKRLYMMVLRGLSFLQRVGVEHVLNHISTLEREDGVPYSIQLVKELKGFRPLLEFRINWRFQNEAEAGAARILFVNLERQSVSYLVLIRAIVKSRTRDPAFEQQRDEAFRLLPSFFQNPGQYITLSGEEN